MAKKKINIKYKSQKRERNKTREVTTKDEFKDLLKNVLGIAVFLGLAYLCILGMTRLGLFEKGYTAPEKKDVVVNTDYIAMGAVFNRKENTYYVLFDNYKNNYTSDSYINSLLESKEDITVYKVDMSTPENSKFASTEENKEAKNASELKINGVTLIRIKNGKIDKYISGSEAIEEFLSK